MCWSSLLSLFLSLQRYILLGTQRAESLGFGGGGGRKIRGTDLMTASGFGRGGVGARTPFLLSGAGWAPGSGWRFVMALGPPSLPCLTSLSTPMLHLVKRSLPPPFVLTRTCRRRRCTWKQQVPSASPRNAQKTLPLFRGSPCTGQRRSRRSGGYPHARVCQAMCVEGTVQSSSLRMEPGSF